MACCFGDSLYNTSKRLMKIRVQTISREDDARHPASRLARHWCAWTPQKEHPRQYNSAKHPCAWTHQYEYPRQYNWTTTQIIILDHVYDRKDQMERSV